jgi:hypothetical protein
MNTRRLIWGLLVLAMQTPGARASGIPPGTMVLAEVAHVAQGDEATQGFKRTAGPDEGLNGTRLKADKATPAKHAMAACGVSAANASGHSFVLLRLYYYWNNQSAGVVHDFVAWAVVGPDVQVADGNIVKVELLAGPSDSRCATVRAVVSASLKGSDCEYRKNEMGTVDRMLGAVNPLGGPGSASVYCPLVDKEGWKKLSITAFPGAAVWSSQPTAPGG